ncbi:MAG TPA: GNAT family N-acetyltransferase [Allosphingosinicella sp.]|jgi:CelD/BcsL family acetyltransferase involved in cellulose biosynthesis
MRNPPSLAGAGPRAETVALPMRIGARTLLRLHRRLVRVPLALGQVLAGAVPELPPLAPEDHGFLVTSLPVDLLPALRVRHPALRGFVRQRYRRSYASLGGGFDAWLATLSARSRSTLKRKLRRFAERSGGAPDLRCYRSPAEVEEFHRHARAVSALTYQERLLGAGLPDGDEAMAAMRALAGRDAMRGWVLFLEGRPVSYLYAPAEGDVLIYAHLGYDPAIADLSPGTVLQFEAMRQLMEEGRFALFDFTEGEGQHKRQFGTDAVDCVDLLLLRPGVANTLTGRGLTAFDAAVAAAKAAVARLGLERLARRLRR